jgi:hypothetical protein
MQEYPSITLSDLKIRTKDKKLVTFQPNPVQIRYLDLLNKDYPAFDWRNGIYTLCGIREDVLKARQQGMSTLWLALYFLDTINNPLTQTIILAHDAQSTEKLFKIVHRFYENLPKDKRRPKKYSNRREIEFSDIDSGIYVGTAGGSGVGRGGTLNNVHMSERAFWKDGDEVETGLLEAVPVDGNVTRETTANGMNDYYAERQRARNGESNFKPRFFGWYLHPEYCLQPEPGFVRTTEEEECTIAYNLSNEQLAWRRNKARDLKEKFPQEYPATEEEAFIASGTPYFDAAKLLEISRHLEHIATLDIEVPGEYTTLRRLAANGGLQVWQTPQPCRIYIISADTAEGIDDHGEHDYDSADVWDAATWEQVAHLHGRWDTNEYGIALAQLGQWFNTALLAIERNNHGHAVINAALFQANYPEARHGEMNGLYFHQEYDENRKPVARRPGWPTTPKTKYLALDQLATATADGDIKLRCRETIGEMMTFVKLPGGKAGADGAGHDDRVSSAAIGAALLNFRPRRPWWQDRATLTALRGSEH